MSVIHLLGSPHALVAGASVALPASKPSLLLIYLLLVGEWVTRDMLAELLFPQVDPSASRANLRVLLTRAGGLPWAQGLQVERSRVRFAAQTDVQEFLEAVQAGRHAQAIAQYQPLLSGFALEGVPELAAFFEDERRRLQVRYVQALVGEAQTLRAGGQPRQALTLLERALTADPLGEDALQAALALCLQVQDRERGLKLYAQFRRVLHAEAGVEPLAATQALMRELGAPASAAPTVSLPEALRAATLFIGREAEVARLQRALPGRVILAGEAGMGKSTLLRRALPEAQFLTCQEGLSHVPYHPLVAWLRQHPPPVLGPYDEDLARLLPDLYPHLTPGPFDPQVGKLRLLEALTRALQGGAVVLDDAQWADPATLEWLTFLRNRPEVSLVLAYRSEERSPALKGVLRILEEGALTLPLAPLSAGTLGDWLAQLTGQGREPQAFAAWLSRHSGGNPLYALETLRSLFESGVLRADQGGWHTIFDDSTRDYEELPPPPKLQALIAGRTGRLSAQAQQVLAALSLYPQATPDFLTELLGFQELEVLSALEEAEAAAFVRQGQFAHDLLRQSVALGLSAARRRHLHRRIAEHLEGQALESVESSVLAWHWQQAGQPQRAWPARYGHALQLAERGQYDAALAEWRALLGELPPGHALEVGARIKLGRTLFWQDMPEGETHLQAALDLIEWGQHGPADLLKLETLVALAEVKLYHGQGARAEALLEDALSLAQTLPHLPEDLRRYLIESRVEVGFRRGQYARTRAFIAEQRHSWPLLATQAALGEFYAGNPTACAREMTRLLAAHPELRHQNAMEADIGLCHLIHGDLPAAAAVLEAGLAQPDQGLHMQALMLTHLGLVKLVLAEPAQAEALLRRAWQIAEGLGAVSYQADILHRQAALRLVQGRLDEALLLISRSHELIQQVGDPYRLVYITCTYAALLCLAGRPDQAEPLLDGCDIQPDTPPQSLLYHHVARANLHHLRGEHEQVQRHLAEEARLCQMHGMVPLVLLRLLPVAVPGEAGASLPA